MKKEEFVNLIGVLMLVFIIGSGLVLVANVVYKDTSNQIKEAIITAEKRDETESVKTYVVDSCEYIGRLGTAYSDVLAHKGNCRFCEKRK